MDHCNLPTLRGEAPVSAPGHLQGQNVHATCSQAGAEGDAAMGAMKLAQSARKSAATNVCAQRDCPNSTSGRSSELHRINPNRRTMNSCAAKTQSAEPEARSAPLQTGKKGYPPPPSPLFLYRSESTRIRPKNCPKTRGSLQSGSQKNLHQTQQRPGIPPEPLPVICWDWTKAIALPRVPWLQRSSLPELLWVWGAMP